MSNEVTTTEIRDITQSRSPKKAQAPAQVFGQEKRSQGTMVEQARAIAEVQAAVMLAQQHPRDMEAALDRMRVVCRIMGLAERAFFTFPRAGQTISGESIHLARELARCWGNINYGVKELSRNDTRGESEMMAFAWDLETNARTETTFIVPHMRDKRGGPERLTDMRDIYENNANQAARRVRECVFAVLPKWYTDEATDICRATLTAGNGKSLSDRKVDMIKAFAALGVAQPILEKRAGKSVSGLTEVEVANLSILYRSIRNNEISLDEAFPASVSQHVAEAAGSGAAQVSSLEEKIAAPETIDPKKLYDTMAKQVTKQDKASWAKWLEDSAASRSDLAAAAPDLAEKLNALVLSRSAAYNG